MRSFSSMRASCSSASIRLNVNNIRKATTYASSVSSGVRTSMQQQTNPTFTHPRPPTYTSVHTSMFDESPSTPSPNTSESGTRAGASTSNTYMKTGGRSHYSVTDILSNQVSTSTLLSTPIAMRSFAEWAVFELGDEDH
ncbi:hypothetical protein BCR33DRAFT_718843 [Rhizoclosmatium globosum]|uniref:Uncharacterized protein n=1 Tax=Rhizoclosmatium globosum TaxID=329046 RepID=A0A1Y2C3V4_9FUNG|nr:hypothetical protein BCR33DRAFT_718843 [Rhizoclosmatium globosum]|eukprot:ORY41722.1 hypothetical protein BCR33DRAFT_718843 [Rhizoclosmatium globosum]